MPTENFTTNVDNIRQDSPERVKEKIRTELSSLQKDVFYTIDDNGSVECDMNTVVSYLESIKNLSWDDMKEKGSAWVMAVQIALESIKDEQGNQKYDVGKIDGQFGSNTRSAVRKFQEDCGFTGKDLDGYPGQMTIRKLLEKLGGSAGGVDQPKAGGAANSPEVDENNNKELPADTYKYLKERVGVLLKEWNIYSGNPCYVSSMGKNPEFQVYTQHPKDIHGQNNITSTFNFHDYLSDDGELDENALEKDVREKLGEEINKRNEWRGELNRCGSFISSIKSKSYSVEDLFGSGNKSEWVKVFFSKFKDNKIKFNSVYQDMNEGTVRFEFEIKGRNRKVDWYQQTIDKDELKDENGNYSEKKFREKLKELVEKIAKEKYGG